MFIAGLSANMWVSSAYLLVTQKVWNPANTGSWGTGVVIIYKWIRYFSSDYRTGFSAVGSRLLLTKGNTLYTIMESCHAVANGSSFRPAGPGCGEGGKQQCSISTSLAHTKPFSHSKDTISASVKHSSAKWIAGRGSAKQLKCSQNQSKIKLVVP